MQESAIAGSSAVIFTSTERKIIKERSGEIDPARSFKEIFAEKGIIPKVENEETTIKPEPDIKELEQRQREHFKRLKDSPVRVSRDRIEIGEAEPEVSIAPPDIVKEQTIIKKIELENVEIGDHTVKLVMELNLDPQKIARNFELNNNDLHELIFKIKELHLKRVLANSHEEFDKLSEEIKKETLAAIKPDAKDWMVEQLDKLRKASAEYKLNLLNSLKTMGLMAEKNNNVGWLEKIVKG